MKQTIAIVAGGNSEEAPVSMKGAENLSNMLDVNRFSFYIVEIKGNKWIVRDPKQGEIPVNKDDFSIVVDGNKVIFDCALMIIHGNPGEDGNLQGYFNMIGLPYTSCGLLASALTFDKFACKNYLNPFAIPTAKGLLFRKNKSVDENAVVRELGLPLFVKPNKNGSSVGVTKVKHASELQTALGKAFVQDDEVIVEEYLQGTELTCGIMKTAEKELIFPITEIVSKNEFFDFEAKYQTGFSEEIVPARISTEVEKMVKDQTSNIYDILNCRGIVRIDYIYSNGTAYFLEVNTVPGMSEASIVPKMIKAAGLEPAELLTLLIEEAIKNR
jgi:D-alanine-D-alanine ligase